MNFEWKDVANYLWLAVLPLLKWIWNRQAEDLKEVKDGLHKLRGGVVSADAMRDRKVEVDGLLEARRQGERDVHERLNNHIKDDQDIHNAVLAELRQIGQTVARIEGRLEK